MTKKSLFIVLLLFIMRGWYYSDAQTNIFYVKNNGSGNFSGIDWNNAFSSIQQAIDSAKIQIPKAKVWVAAGTYYGNNSSNYNAFVIENGVDVYGGFAGDESPDFDISLRNFTTNETILDGNNIQRVLAQEVDFSDTTIFDGFTIQNGENENAGIEAKGGGVYLINNVILKNCIIKNNHSVFHGGGIYTYFTGCQVIQCTIQNNISNNHGGGIGAYNEITVKNCTIKDNQSLTMGGGLFLYRNGNVDNCQILGNTTKFHGGGALVYSNSLIKNSIIAGNKTISEEGLDEGAGIFASSSSIIACYIHNNSAQGTSESFGGGVYLDNSESYLINSIVANNTSYGSGGGVYIENSGKIINSTVVNNCSIYESDKGGGIFSDGNDTAFITNTIVWKNSYRSSNQSDAMVSNLRLNYNNAQIHTQISNCAIENGYYGTDNIILDNENVGIFGPNFIAPSFYIGSSDNYQNYQANWCIDSNSICINFGKRDTTGLHLTTTDFFGNPRIQIDRIDIGAFETPNEHPFPNIYPDNNNILYVSEYPSGSQDGSSWNNALGDIQTALDFFDNYDYETTGQIWVSAGTYYGDTDPGNMAFYIRDGVHVFGGFSGTETVAENSDTDIRSILENRNFEANPSILDGQMMQRVLYQLTLHRTDVTSIWDGFTIHQGFLNNSTSNGSGAHVRGNVHFKNCIFSNNQCTNNGAGLCMLGNSKVENCTFINNISFHEGGAIYTHGGSIINCTISDNKSSFGGAGINMQDSGMIVNCQIRNNDAGTEGGGVYLNGGSVINCLISNNKCGNIGGGGVRLDKHGILTNNTIVNNQTATNSQGGGILSESGTITNCLIWGNRRGSLPSQVFSIENPQQPISNFNFCAVEGGCTGNKNHYLSNQNTGTGFHYPKFTNPLSVVGPTDSIGDWRLNDSSVCINTGRLDTIGLNLPSKDLWDNNRIQNDTIDIGAFESHYHACPIPPISESGIIYVKEGGTGIRDGSSWSNAFPTIQNALNIVSSDDTVMVWVAAGTYYSTGENSIHPDSSALENTTNTNGINMLPGIKVYGSFSGTEPENFDLSQRDYDNNITIIDGGGTSRILYQTNPYSLNQRSVFDGFRLTHGYSSSVGGAVYLLSNGVIKNCIINYSIADSLGGGIYMYGGGDIYNCVIHNNSAQFGGGIYINYQDSYYPQQNSIINCAIFENTATISGGGIYHHNFNEIEQKLLMSNLTIAKNTCTEEAGGIYSGKGIEIYNSIIWGNKKTTDEHNQFHWSDSNNIIRYSAIENDLPPSNPTNIMLSSENDGALPNINYPRFYNIYDNNFKLHETSCCFNTGNNDNVMSERDCDGNNRIMFDIVDQGAYETDDTSWCEPITNLKVDSQSNVTVWISWLTEGYHLRFEVFYKNLFTGESFSKISHTNNCVLSGLAPNTEYEVYVRGNCLYENEPPFTTNSINIRFETTCDTTTYKFIDEMTLCSGTGGIWRGKSLINYEIGNYIIYDSLKTICFADSVFQLNLFVAGKPELPQTETLVNNCEDENFTLFAIPGMYGNTCRWYISQSIPSFLAESTSYTPPLISVGEIKNFWLSSYNDSTYCESDRIMVTVFGHETYNETFDLTVCDTLFWIDTLISEDGTYSKSLVSQFGCDSMVTLNVTISESPTLNYIGELPIILESCVGDSIQPLIFELSGSADSVIFTNLPIGLTVSINNNIVTVRGIPTIIDQFSCTVETVGQEYPCEPASYTRTFTVFDCNVPLYGKQNVCISNIESYKTLENKTNYHWIVTGGTILNGQATDSIVVQWNTLGEGSIYISFDEVMPVIYTINVYNIENSSWEHTACDQFQWNDSVYYESGVYQQILKCIHDCDSTVTLTLTIHHSNNNTFERDECDLFVWNGIEYTESGQYEQILTNLDGCDSVVTLNLNIFQSSDTLFFDTICLNDHYQGYGFDTIPTNTGLTVCQRTLTNMVGCDSIITLNLTVHPSYFFEENENIYGEAFHWHNRILSEPGTYWDSLTTIHNCDSIFKLNLMIVVFVVDTQELSICQGESVTWHQQVLTTSGIYRDTVHVAPAFDSIYILDLTVNPSYNFETTSYICDGDSILFNGVYFYEEGTYPFVYESSMGCDSNYILRLFVRNVITPIIIGPSATCFNSPITLTVNTGQAFIWSTGATTREITVTPTTTTIYSVIVVDSNGCVSRAEKEITVFPQLMPSITGNALVCLGESTTLSVIDGGTTFIWNNGATTPIITVQPTETTNFTVTTTDVNGCTATASIQVVVEIPAIPSEVTAIKFSGHIMVVWMGNEDTYQLFRNDGFSTIVSENMYEDFYIEQDHEYCYNVTSFVTETCQSELSSTACQSIPSTCEPPENINYSLENLDGIKWVYLTWDTAYNTNYYIIKCNDNIIAQTNNHYYNDTITTTTNEIKCYTIESHCFNENTSAASDSVCVYIVSMTENPDYQIRIYPNPANHQITIEGEKIDQVFFYNLLGQMIKTQSFNQSDKIQFETKSFDSGLYFIKIITQNGEVISKRIMITH